MDCDLIYTWHAPENSFRVQSVMGSYDLKEVKLEKHIRCSLPVEHLKWQIGVITGLSGSGKTSIAKKFAEHFQGLYFTSFPYTQPCFLDDFPPELSTHDVEMALNSAGFSEPPSWLKNYNVLSTGQKMRVDVARALCSPEQLVVFDEFTSVVDRTVAQIGSLAISKNVQRHPSKQFLAVTCHSDVIDWLEPDWSFCMDTNIFTDYSGTLQPAVTAQGTVFEVKKNDVTRQSTSLSANVGARCGRCLGNIII